MKPYETHTKLRVDLMTQDDLDDPHRTAPISARPSSDACAMWRVAR